MVNRVLGVGLLLCEKSGGKEFERKWLAELVIIKRCGCQRIQQVLLQASLLASLDQTS